jgi:UDP-N-acetylglucosamine---dolichyl-phosphate N-acetylglucosaminyltransferase
MSPNNELFVIIPAYNESRTIYEVIKKTQSITDNIVIVDDGSSDKTYKAAVDAGAKHVLQHVVNLGKGAALKTGCDFAVSRGAEILVVMDGDNQHDPAVIPKLVDALSETRLIIGSRKIGKGMPLVFTLGNIFIQYMTKFLYGVKIKDTQSGFRAFSSRNYSKIRWNSTDYSMESEMIAKACLAGLRIYEIPIKTVYHDSYKGTTIFDGVKIITNMIKWRLFGWNK